MRHYNLGRPPREAPAPWYPERTALMKRAISWLLPLLRYGLCVVAIAYLVYAISWYDYVALNDPAETKVRLLRYDDAAESFTVLQNGETRELTSADVKYMPGDRTDGVEGQPVPKITWGIRGVVVRMDYAQAFLAILLFLPVPFMSAVRLVWMLRVQGVALSHWNSIKLTFAGNFFNFALPGTTGGDLVKAYYVSRFTRHKTEAVTTIFLDRVVGLLGLMFVASATFALAWNRIEWPVQYRNTLALGLLAIWAGLGLGCIVLFSRRLRHVLGLPKLAAMLPAGEQLLRIGRTLTAMRTEARLVLQALMLTVALQGIVVISAYVMARALGMSGSSELYFISVPIGFLVASIPITPPQGFGVMETLYVVCFTQGGLNHKSAAVAFALAVRLIQLVWALPGVLVPLLGAHVPTKRELQELGQDDETPPDDPTPRPSPPATSSAASAPASQAAPPAGPASRLVRVGRLALIVGTLATVVYLVHERSLHYGLFMDDYAHYQQLRESGWSLGDLTAACRLELVGGVAQFWWLPECTLRFFRPVAFGVMKLAYTASDWRPVALHAVSLGWHMLACVLLAHLLLRLGIGLPIALMSATLFAVHPGHVATIQWIAAQTELIVTTFLLAATLCYLRARGRSIDDLRPTNAFGWGAASAAFFALALGCRENAIMFPVVVASIEAAVRRPGRRVPWRLFATYAVLVVAYLGIRSHYLGGASLPPRPYVFTPSDPGFFQYIFDKALYYVLGEFLCVPSVPFAGLTYFRGSPLAFYGLSVGVLAIVFALSWKNRRTPAGILSVAWLFGFMAPVLPAFESPHHLYLPGIGWAITCALLLQWIAGPAPRRWAEAGRSIAASLVSAGAAALFLMLTVLSSETLETAQEVEDQVSSEIVAATPSLQDGDTLYIANLPMIAHYTQLAVEYRTGRRGLRVAPLTWSTRLLGMVSPAELNWVNDHTLEIRVANEQYFAGPIGRLVAEANPAHPSVAARLPLETPDFRVELVDGDASGIRALRFVFRQNPRIAGQHLFWGSQTRWAARIP